MMAKSNNSKNKFLSIFPRCFQSNRKLIKFLCKMILSKLRIKTQLVKSLKSCKKGCQQSHSIEDSFTFSYEIFQDLWKSEEMQNLDDIELFNIHLGSTICMNKWSILCKQVLSKEKKHIVLRFNLGIDNLNFELHQLLHKNVIGIIISGTYKKNTVIYLMELIQSSENLIYLNFNSNYYAPDSFSESPFLQGSLVNLKELIISSMFNVSIQSFERILIEKDQPHGNLQYLYLQQQFKQLRRKDVKSLGRIIQYNRNSLTNFSIEQEYDKTPLFNLAINEVGLTLQGMAKLQKISIVLKYEIWENKNINIAELMIGIQSTRHEESNEIVLMLLQFTPTISSKVGETLALFQKVTFSSSLSTPSATQIGIELGKSKILKDLTIDSYESCLNLLLSHTLHFASHLERLSISPFFENKEQIMSISRNVGKMKNLRVFELTSLKCFFTKFQDLYEFFRELSKCPTLRSIKFGFEQGDIEDILDAKQLASPFYKMNQLQQLNFNCFAKNVKNNGEYLKFFQNLIIHTNVLSLENEDDYFDLLKMKEEYQKSLISQFFFLVVFMKEVKIYLIGNSIKYEFDLYL